MVVRYNMQSVIHILVIQDNLIEEHWAEDNNS